MGESNRLGREIVDIVSTNRYAVEACKQVKDPMVSIGMLVYNQRKYIRSAIESVLQQEVSFSYEIVIADDCSTDGTRDIVLEYAEKYPDVIRVILQEENVGLVENSKCLKRACRGRYRATQEGDDFWIDTNRLQRQVEFLENNPEYVAVCGGLIAADDKGQHCAFPWGGLSNTYKLEGDYGPEDIEDWKLPCHAGAWLSYNIFAFLNQEDFDRYESYAVTGDRKTAIYTMQSGKVHIFPEKIMVRRLLWNSPTSHMNTYKKVSTPARVFLWAKETQKMDREFVHLGLNMLPTMDKMFLITFRDLLKKPCKFHLDACRTVFAESPKKLHHLKLLNGKLVEKVRGKIKKDGFFGLIKAAAKKIKAVLKKEK